MPRPTRAFAIAAHPDDIEFGMAGTLFLLGHAGCELHYLNLADGCCGSVEHDRATTASVRLEEARTAAAFLGATHHPPLVADLEVFYELPLIRRVASIVRAVAPDILLVPSPDDYMEDHMNACRVAVTAAFARGMPNFPVDPPRDPIDVPVAVYHAQPHGNRDGLGRFVTPDFLVDVTSAIGHKAQMLAAHVSQKDWLDRSQGMDAYINTMKDHSHEMALLVGKEGYAEGWRRHNPLGFGPADADPLRSLLADHILPIHRD